MGLGSPGGEDLKRKRDRLSKKTLQDLGAVETRRARQREEAETGSQRFSGLPPQLVLG